MLTFCPRTSIHYLILSKAVCTIILLFCKVFPLMHSLCLLFSVHVQGFTHIGHHITIFLFRSLSLFKEQRCDCVPAFLLFFFFLYFFSDWGCSHYVEFWFACHSFHFLIPSFFFFHASFRPSFLPLIPYVAEKWRNNLNNLTTDKCFLWYNTVLQILTK